VRYILLMLVLFGMWLLWSGNYTLDYALVFVLGVVSCLFVVYMVRRMEIDDDEGLPLHAAGALLLYIPYLLWEIVKSNIDMARRVLSPTLPISPRMLRVKATQHTELGRVIYANSMTLTPSTVAVDVEGDEILVHVLTKEAAEDLKKGAMDRRVTQLEA